ncbi:MAG: hypothetical protein ABI747_04035, partial [Candidatus Moraniibacteriota bacterium]
LFFAFGLFLVVEYQNVPSPQIVESRQPRPIKMAPEPEKINNEATPVASPSLQNISITTQFMAQPGNCAGTLSIDNVRGTGLDTEVQLKRDGKEVAKIDVQEEVEGSIFTHRGCRVYIGLQFLGLGGYINYLGPTGFFLVDLSEGTITEILHMGYQQGFVDDISADGQMIAISQSQEMQIINLKGEVMQKFPIEDPYTVGGDGKFSLDGSQFVYAAAVNEPDAERGAVYLANRKTGTQKLLKQKQGLFFIDSWKGNAVSEIQFTATN